MSFSQRTLNSLSGRVVLTVCLWTNKHHDISEGREVPG